jgi:hypothetical protein
MNKSQLNDRAERLFEINDVIKQLTPEIRAPAFELLKAYVASPSTTEMPATKGATTGLEDQDSGEREAFFSRFDTDKPADNALLIAAYYYSQHGTDPFNADALKNLAREIGLIVPERIDMTIRNARRDGRTLFQSIGRGGFRPTVHGEVFFKTTYNVTPPRRQSSQTPEPPPDPAHSAGEK